MPGPVPPPGHETMDTSVPSHSASGPSGDPLGDFGPSMATYKAYWASVLPSLGLGHLLVEETSPVDVLDQVSGCSAPQASWGLGVTEDRVTQLTQSFDPPRLQRNIRHGSSIFRIAGPAYKAAFTQPPLGQYMAQRVRQDPKAPIQASQVRSWIKHLNVLYLSLIHI